MAAENGTTGGKMAPVMKLNEVKCEKAMPRAKPYWVADWGGMGLLVTPTAGKLWRWRYRFQSKYKQMAFGKYPGVSLARARELHVEARALLATGVDPMALRKEQKRVARSARTERIRTLPRGEQARFQRLYETERLPLQAERARAHNERAKEETRVTRAAFTELVKYLEAIGIPMATIENEIVTRSEHVLIGG
jgi:hypothetical protein